MALDASEENQAMLGHSNCKKAPSIKSVCEDIQNNNNNNNNVKNETDLLRNKGEISAKPVRYTSNAKGILAQCLVTGAALLLTTGGGMPIGYSAVMLPQLSENNSAIHVDREVGSWIASIHSLATPFGSLVSGPLMDGIGRRSSLQVTAIPMCIGWLIIGFSRSVTSILVGRFICGLSVGLMAVPIQAIVAEMADARLRGPLVGGGFASYSLGILLVYGLGASYSWDVVAFSAMVLPIVGFIALCLVPESPAWLVRQKKTEKARKALLWLRGGDMEQANAEVAILEARMKADLAERSVNISLKRRIFSAVTIVCDLDVLKPLMIINVYNALQLFSGTYIIIFYAVDMVNDIGGGNVNNYLAAVVTAVIRFIFSLLSCVLLLKMGRRTLGIVSATGTALASLVLAGYTFARTDSGSSVDLYVISVCVLIYVAMTMLGLITLPVMMTGELLPMKARGIGGGYIFFLFNFLLFFVTKCFPSISSVLGVNGVFTMFGIFALLATVFIYLVVPETKNSTLEEIEDYFKGSNLLWVTRPQVKRKTISISTTA